jgi:ribonucleotide reductase alpha subunit
MKEIIDYFKGDELAASVWKSKYAMKGEKTPKDMHKRMAREFARIEEKYGKTLDKEILAKLSNFGRYFEDRFWDGDPETAIQAYFDNFGQIVPQGSIMSMLGNKYKIGSLSNCFVVGQPHDSYGGIMQKDQELVQLMKRRGGVGIDISTLRPSNTLVSNAAGSSTGAVSFMHRYSNSCREVAQNGRRGALMITIDCRHPDVLEFINVKKDLTQVTGANISVQLRDDFMQAVKDDKDYLLRFPCNKEVEDDFSDMEYNKLETWANCVVKRVKAREYFNSIVECNWLSAEPGLMFVDKHWNYSPDGVYPQYRGITTNPCFHPDTLIETVNGRVKIKDLDYHSFVYSKNKDGSLCIRRATPSFISKKNAETLKITLKSGNSIQVTPEHKLYVQNNNWVGWKEAKDLKIGDSIAHLCRSRRGAKYSGVHLTTSPNRQLDQVMEHRLVYESCNKPTVNDIHHIDGNTFNNKISNLQELTHEEHSKHTAINQNPQAHQIKDELGRFTSGENSKKGAKTIANIPDEFKTNMLSRHHNKIISIKQGETTDVYDIQVEGTHCLIANNMVAHNCGEIFMAMYDACRLLALNFYNIVVNHFTNKAEIDYHKLYEIAYIQQRLADDIVDLELEYIDNILRKIDQDDEPEEIKITEKLLWENIKKVASSSRRTGAGFTALADMLAALNLKYDSKEAKETIERVCKRKLQAELDCTIDLAILRGTFKGWDKEFEFTEDSGLHGNNDFYTMLISEFSDQAFRMFKYGRRNVSWNTVAPTGTVSLMTQTTSGLEPLFSPYYFRNKKVNAEDKDSRVDYVDQNGDSWMEYPVLHPKFKDWLQLQNGGEYNEITWNRENLDHWFKISPWYGSCANDIDWISRVEIQAIIQRYTTHSISSTINLPENVSQGKIAEIYMKAWESGLKGITVKYMPL